MSAGIKFTVGKMVANIFTVGCLVVAVVSGVLSVNIDNAVERAEPLASGLVTQASIWLLNKDETSNNVFLCSGSIIERDHVLAHAKCIEYYKAANLRIALGKAELNATDEMFYKVKSITYEAETEMALLRTEKDTFATSSVAALRDTTLGADSKCFVSGWLDSTTAWQKQEVAYIADADCKKEYETTNAMVEEGNICARGQTDKNCGSLGMPLFCDDQLTGLFSITDWECKLPAQCAGVPHSKSWIQEQLALARGGASNMRPSLFAAIAALLLAYKTFA